MSGGADRGLVESVKQRLLNLSAVRGETFNVLLMRYGVERLLYRMSRGPHADAFVLKGAMLFAIWADKPHPGSGPARVRQPLHRTHGTGLPRDLRRSGRA